MEGILRKTNAKILLIVMALIILSTCALTALTSTNASEESNIDMSKVNNILEIKLDKYINYNAKNEKGVQVELDVKNSIEYPEELEHLLIGATGTKIQTPKINGEFPESVEILKINTKLTNASNNTDDLTYSYDSEKGEISVVVQNKNAEDGELKTTNIKEEKDNFKVILNYGEKCYTPENEIRNLEVSGKVISVIGQNMEKASGEIETKFEVAENISNFVSNNITTTPIYNGFIKSNIKYGTEFKTEYEEYCDIEITKKDIADEIQFEISNNIEEGKNKYISSKVDIKEMTDILGENGTIEFLDEKGNSLGKVDSKTILEDGIFKVDYENATKIFVKMSKPEKVGILRITNNKELDNSFTDLDVENIEETTKITLVSKEDKTEITDIRNIEILESKSEVKFVVDNVEWTNKEANDVNFNIQLITNEDSKYNLYKDPIFDIQLPSEIEKINLDEIILTNGNGLILSKTNYDETTRTIRVELLGEQTDYIKYPTTIIVPAKVVLNNDITTSESTISLAYTNNIETVENAKLETKLLIKNFQEEVEEEQPVEQEETPVETNKQEETTVEPTKQEEPTEPTEATVEQKEETAKEPVRVTASEKVEDIKLTTSGISLAVNATRGKTALTTTEPTVYEGEFIKYSVTVKNTSEKQLEDVRVKGIIPEGTTYVKYKSTFSKLDTPSFYEYDKNAKTTDFINVGTLKPDQSRTIYFEIKVNDLEENTDKKDITTKIYGFVGDKAAEMYEISHIVKKAEYTVTATATRRNAVEFTTIIDIKSKNDSDERVTIKLMPDEKFHNISFVRDIEELRALGVERGSQTDERAEKISDTEYSVKPGKYNLFAQYDNQSTITNAENDAEVLYNNFTVNNKYNANETRLIYYHDSVSINMESSTELEELEPNSDIEYKIEVENKTRTNFENIPAQGNKARPNSVSINLQDYLPEEIKAESVEYTTFKLNEETGKFVKEQKTEKISSGVTATNGVKLPELNLYLTIPYGEKVNITIKAKTKELLKKTEINNSATVNQLIGSEDGSKSSYQTLKICDSNIVSHVITPIKVSTPSTPETPEIPTPEEPTPETPEVPTPEKPEEEKPSGEIKDTTKPETDNKNEDKKDEKTEVVKPKYSISGLAWKDVNEDGKRQSSEVLLTNLETLLMNAEGKVVSTTKTSEEGIYSFNDIESGKYVVVFKYNTIKYRPTKYKVSGDTTNSDAINTSVEINGEITNCAVTDIINLKSNMTNIDIGLLENKKFNFKVDKYVSKVTVKSASGTNVSEFNNSKLAKVEIHSKEIEGATVLVEYKIVVTNNGEIAGKVGTITDRLPEGLKFSSELSKSWSKTTDGTLKNNSIANKTIEPGQSAEFTLLATKTMTSNDTGTFTNVVQIGTLSNEAKIQETDLSDNTSNADLIISVSTGSTTMIIITIITSIIALIGLIIFLNARYKIFRRISRFGIMSFILAVVIVASYSTNVIANGGSVGITFDPSSNNGTMMTGAYGTDGNYYTCNNSSVDDGISNSWGVGADGKWTGTGTKVVSGTSTSGHTIVKEWNDPADAESFDLNISLDDATIMHESGGSLIIQGVKVDHTGPTEGCSDYTFTITGINGSTTTVTAGPGQGTYDLTVSLSQFEDGISSVAVKATLTYTHYWIEEWTETITVGGTDGTQEMTTTITHQEEHNEERTKEAEDIDTMKTCNLKLQKSDEFGPQPTDEYGNKISLKGIQFIVKGGGKTFTLETITDEGLTNVEEGLKPGAYTIYEVIDTLPERLKDFYKESQTDLVDGHKVKLIGTANPVAGQILKYPGVNLRDLVSLQLHKVDKSDNEKLQTIKFRIREVESGKWVKWRVNPDYHTNVDPKTGIDDAKYIVDELLTDAELEKYLNDNKNNEDMLKLVTLVTGTDGKTEKVKRFDLKKTYEIYEVDAGEYRYIYDISDVNGGTKYGLLVDTWKPENDKTGINHVTLYNKQTIGSLNINKFEKITEAQLAGMGFKIKIKGTNHDGEWIVAEQTKDIHTGKDIYERTGFTKNYEEATIFYTQADGKTFDIHGLPVYDQPIEAKSYDPSKNYKKCSYEIYEVYIPEPLRLYFSLDPKGEKVYEATKESEALLINNEIIINEDTGKAEITDNIRTITVIDQKDDKNSKEPKNEEKDLPNKQIFARVSGNVWEEVLTFEQNKTENMGDNKYTNGEDNDINGIPVRIVDKSDKNKVIHETVTGRKTVNGQTINGHYEFTHVKIDKFKDYLVQFTYDGVTYERVLTGDELNPAVPYTYDPITNATDYSRAKELVEDRDNLNDTFKEVTGEEQKMDYDRKVVKDGYVVNEVNNVTITYAKEDGYVLADNLCRRNANGHENVDTANHVVTLSKDIDSYDESFKAQGDYTIDSETQEVDNYYKVWIKKYRGTKVLFEELPYLNLGLYVRTQPDLSIDKDIYKADVSINGKNYTYLYGKKDSDPKVKNASNQTNGQVDNSQLTTLGVQFEKNVQLDGFSKYLLPIYRADVEDYKGPEQYSARVMYRIKVVNDHATLYSKVNVLEDYFSTKFTNDSSNLPRVYIGETAKDRTFTPASGVTVTVDSNTVDGNKHCTISGLDLAISPKDSGEANVRYVYIEFDLDKKIILKTLNNQQDQTTWEDIYNIVEISSYTTYYDKACSKLYAGFDSDSIPNNNYIDKDYGKGRDPKEEDDVDGAPGLRMTEATKRSISGMVFVDATNKPSIKVQDDPGGVRAGNGYYDDGETKLENVYVTLQDVNDENNKYGPVKTNSEGKFTIENFYAADYKLIYTWGKDTKSTGHENDNFYNPDRFKSTILNSEYVNKINNLRNVDQPAPHNEKKMIRSSWWYQEDIQEAKTAVTQDRVEGKRYSEAVDVYEYENGATGRNDNYTRKAIDKVKAKTNEEIIYENMENNNIPVGNINSETEKLSIEIDILAKDDNYIQGDDQNRIYYYDIRNIDFGIVERPEQALEITKQLSHIKIVDNYGTIIAESDIKDGKLVNTDVKYTVYLPGSTSNQYGTLKSEIDNSYLPANVIATYTITVKNMSEKDFYRADNGDVLLRDEKDVTAGNYGRLASYYVYGVEEIGEKKDQPVLLKPAGVYDYITETYGINSVKYADINGKNETGDADYEIVTEAKYMSNGNVKYENDTTIVETGYERIKSGTSMDTYEWATDKQNVKQRYEEWFLTGYEVKKAKLEGKKIINLEGLQQNLEAGQSNTVNVEATTTVASSKDNIVLQNEAEITRIERTSKFGRRLFENYKVLFDKAEEIIITPPTGEDKDTSNTIMIITASIIGIAVLGAGIIIIKKKVLNA